LIHALLGVDISLWNLTVGTTRRIRCASGARRSLLPAHVHPAVLVFATSAYNNATNAKSKA